MIPTVLVTDTHPLIWYVADQHRKLPKRVKRAFDEAVEGRIAIYVPIVAVWELSLIIRTGRVRAHVSLEECITGRFFAKAIHVLDLQIEDILRAHSLYFNPSDAFDTLIVAMCLRLDQPLISGDTVMHESRPCKLFWD